MYMTAVRKGLTQDLPGPASANQDSHSRSTGCSTGSSRQPAPHFRWICLTGVPNFFIARSPRSVRPLSQVVKTLGCCKPDRHDLPDEIGSPGEVDDKVLGDPPRDKAFLLMVF